MNFTDHKYHNFQRFFTKIITFASIINHNEIHILQSGSLPCEEVLSLLDICSNQSIEVTSQYSKKRNKP